jgi:hypothetical protein
MNADREISGNAIPQVNVIPPDPDAVIIPATPEAKVAVFQRLKRAGLWNSELAALRDEMVQGARKAGLSKDQSQAWAYTELERMYLTNEDGSPKVVEKPAKPVIHESATEEGCDQSDDNGGSETVVKVITPAEADSAGLRAKSSWTGDPPATWPDLPASASLAAELAWVQSNRLWVVSETAKGPVCDLSRALEPAPSRSALAWLETSCRNYAKYTDVLAKIAAQATDEADTVRRERASLIEIEKLLGSMATGF